VKNFRKSFLKRHISSNHFEKAWRAYIYVCAWLQKVRERYSKRISLSNALSTTLGQTLANLLRVHPRTSNCIIHSKGEKYFCSSQKVNCNQETGCLLNCEFPEHKEKEFLGCSKVVKMFFYKDSGKSQVGCLRTGRRHGKWPNQYKSSLHFSLPLSHLFYCNQFCLAYLKNIIKLIVARGGNRLGRPTGAYDLAYIKPGLAWPI